MSGSTGMTTATDPNFSSFNQEVFWALHGKKVVWGSIVAALILIAVGAYLGWQAVASSQAQAAYDSATNIDGWRSVVDRFPGSIAAGNALLRIASQQSSDGHFPDSDKTYQRFVREYPKHPFAVNGLMGLGTNAEAEAKPEEALNYYTDIGKKFATTYLAPVAMLNQARLTENKGQLQEARQLYELLIQRYPQSALVQTASAEASRLNDRLGHETTGASPTPQPSASVQATPASSEKPKRQPEP
jgi:outer membrane protein assembly factor BamD (BamD/ComL family)